ncbi:MAG: hypothetical protein AAAFM81_06135 [Pseudomonadota bacterium]
MTSLTQSLTNQLWIRRAGKIGFWFFMIKGILWMAAPLVFYHML